MAKLCKSTGVLGPVSYVCIQNTNYEKSDLLPLSILSRYFL